MPITVSIVNHPATEWTRTRITTSEKLLEAACPRQYRRCQRVVQSSFTRSAFRTGYISASENGFVWAAYHAYSQHHHLVIRPEDVWFAILTQLSFFINANAEQLRTFFVQHDDQKELEVISNIADFGALAVQMTGLLAKNVVDPELREWVMPSFTTTTATDQVVGAILFMGAMQKYFSYKMTLTCGLPSITLLGEVGDWKEILRRLDKIDLLGEEPRQFAHMLRPILQHMILSFEDPASTEVTRFWNTIVHHNPMDSGTDYLSGWLTAFCFWSPNGAAKRRGMGSELFGGIGFPSVDIDDVPVGFASVPVTVDDNGDVYSATMVAGSVGIAASNQSASSNAPSISSLLEEQQDPVSEATENESSDEAAGNTIQPVTGWWMCENEASEEVEAREAEMKRLRDELSQKRKHKRSLGDNYLDKLIRLQKLEAY